MKRLPLSQLDTAGAVSGNVPTYNAAKDCYEPAAPAGGSGGSGSAGALLAVKDYNPATAATLSTTAVNTTQDLDATNLAATFTAPASGRVLVRLTAVAQNSTSPAFPHWFLREGTTAIAGRWINSASAAAQSISVAFVISGLTPGSSHTYKWAQATDSGVLTTSAGGPVTLSGAGPAVMEVWAA